MATIPLGPAPAKQTAKGLVPFALGFRPFFLAAGAAALGLMIPWLLMWVGRWQPDGYYGFIGWHAHEMLFGYGLAVIAGFLLTAVRNWTGIPTPTGVPLAALALLWLVGRLLPFGYPVVPGSIIATVDLLFLPALLWALSVPLWKGANRMNRLFMPLLGAMWLANLLIHAQSLELFATAGRGQDLMRNLILLLVALIGGRVMPFFTEKAIPEARPKRSKTLEYWSFGFLLFLIAVELLYPVKPLLASAAAGVAITQALRLAGWHHKGVWRIPILWVLYTGFGWLILGFVLKVLGLAGAFPPNLAVHALTVGAIGVLTLGMMSRVALGHSGRMLESSKSTNLAFISLNLGAAVRVFGPLAVPDNYVGTVHMAGGLWLLAFLIFTVNYAPVLLKPRVDGRPG